MQYIHIMYHPYPFRKPTLCKEHDPIYIYIPIQGQCESVSPCLKTFQNYRNSVNALISQLPHGTCNLKYFTLFVATFFFFWGGGHRILRSMDSNQRRMDILLNGKVDTYLCLHQFIACSPILSNFLPALFARLHNSEEQ